MTAFGESRQQFEASIDLRVRLAYPEAQQNFSIISAIKIFTAGVSDSELQEVLQMERYQNNADSLVHPLQFEATKYGWANHKVHTLKDLSLIHIFCYLFD